MYRYSLKSKHILSTCDERLQRLFNKVIEHIDCSIICGHRDKLTQNMAHIMGRSQVSWPNSKHNISPSKAVDVAPYIVGVCWDIEPCTYFAGVVMGIAKSMSIPIRWGGDWNMDNNISNETFRDLCHFEIRD